MTEEESQEIRRATCDGTQLTMIAFLKANETDLGCSYAEGCLQGVVSVLATAFGPEATSAALRELADIIDSSTRPERATLN